MKKILVPVDFEPASKDASEYAAQLAIQFNAVVTLLYVYLEPPTGIEVPAAWVLTTSDLAIENKRRINDEVRYLQSRYAIKVEGSAQVGFTSETIVDTAEEIGADLILMGMKAQKNKIFGSAVTATIRKTNKPVLIVPQGYHFLAIKEIAFASDFNVHMPMPQFALLFQLINKFDAHLHVLHVEKKLEVTPSDYTSGRLHLEKVFSNVSHSYQTLTSQVVDEAIFDFVDKHQYHLLVMIARHHPLLVRLLKNPHTNSMAYQIKIPMLVLKDE